PVEVLQLEDGGFHGERLETSGILEGFETGVDAEQGVLDEVVHVGLAADPAEEEPAQDRLERSEQALAGAVVAGLGAEYDIRIEGGHQGEHAPRWGLSME